MFAAISVQLFVFSSQVLDNWEHLRKCVDNGTCIIESADGEGDVFEDETTTDGTVEE